ncbi:amidase domain-containing protein [Acidaminobacterium chupaoyuni]
MIRFAYQRNNAVAYARRWGKSRNPAYYDFSELGGDCTNFISQCVFAGSGVMNDTPVYGWYYHNLNDRSASWTGVEYFYNFMVSNQGVGPVMEEVSLEELQPGDVIQLGRSDGSFYHTMLVTETGERPTFSNTLITTHSYDAYNRPLDSYDAKVMRFLHVRYVNISREMILRA